MLQEMRVTREFTLSLTKSGNSRNLPVVGKTNKYDYTDALETQAIIMHITKMLMNNSENI